MFKTIFLRLFLIFGYICGVASIGFVSAFFLDILIPKTIGGPASAGWGLSIVIDVVAVGLFGAVHSITARQSVKSRLHSVIPEPFYRTWYLIFSAVSVAALISMWQPLPGKVWAFTELWQRSAFYIGYALISLGMMGSIIVIGMRDFFGLNALKDKPSNETTTLSMSFLYKFTRHPISVGWVLLPLCVPELTWGHVLFSCITILYVAAATPFEEADLINQLGDAYLRYKRMVPRWLPNPFTSKRSQTREDRRQV